jgi:hypothetical protein
MRLLHDTIHVAETALAYRKNGTVKILESGKIEKGKFKKRIYAVFSFTSATRIAASPPCL